MSIEFHPCCPVPCCQGKQEQLSENYLPNHAVQFILSPCTGSATQTATNKIKCLNSFLSVVCGGADPVDGVWCEVVDGDRVGLGLEGEVGEGERLVLVLNQNLRSDINTSHI